MLFMTVQEKKISYQGAIEIHAFFHLEENAIHCYVFKCFLELLLLNYLLTQNQIKYMKY